VKYELRLRETPKELEFTLEGGTLESFDDEQVIEEVWLCGGCA
jgi:hypothetical protein